MAEKKNRMTVDIHGEPYTIVGPEDEGHVKKVAEMVNDKMREIKETNPNLDTKRLAVLTSVNIVNDYLKLEEKWENGEAKNQKEED